MGCEGTATSTAQCRWAPFVTSTSPLPELLSAIQRGGALCPPRCRHRCIVISVVPANAVALVSDRLHLVSREPGVNHHMPGVIDRSGHPVLLAGPGAILALVRIAIVPLAAAYHPRTTSTFSGACPSATTGSMRTNAAMRPTATEEQDYPVVARNTERGSACSAFRGSPFS